MLKAGEQEIPQLHQHVFQDVMDNEVLPDTWKRGTIIKLQKRESVRMQQLEEHHTTFHQKQGFMSHHSPTHHNSIGQTTTPGFRKGKSCIDHIFDLSHILEQSHETALCMWCSWTLRKLLTAYINNSSGRFHSTTESQKDW